MRKWRGWSTGSIFDHRETAAGVGRLPHTVCESVGERWREDAGSFLTLAWVSRTLFVAWRKCTVGQRVAVGSTRDVAIETGAHLSTDSGQHVQLAGRWVPGHTDACTHVGAGGRWDRFSTIEKW